LSILLALESDTPCTAILLFLVDVPRSDSGFFIDHIKPSCKKEGDKKKRR
jgi:hypothetical protein